MWGRKRLDASREQESLTEQQLQDKKRLPECAPAGRGGWNLSPRLIFGCIIIVWILFVALNLRHLFEPFRDYGKPLAGEPYYAVRALNYLRHGCFTHWLGVCDNLNPHPETLKFKFTEMPAFFVVNSLVFRLAGVSSNHFRVVELGYAFALIVSSRYSMETPTQKARCWRT
jgi:hypothetical protein